MRIKHSEKNRTKIPRVERMLTLNSRHNDFRLCVSSVICGESLQMYLYRICCMHGEHGKRKESYFHTHNTSVVITFVFFRLRIGRKKVNLVAMQSSMHDQTRSRQHSITVTLFNAETVCFKNRFPHYASRKNPFIKNLNLHIFLFN